MDNQLREYFVRKLNEMKKAVLEDSINTNDFVLKIQNLISLIKFGDKYVIDSEHDMAFPVVEEELN